MKFLKPHNSCYLLVQGSGRVMSFTEEELKTMSMAYDEIRFVSEGNRRMFSFTSEPIDALLERVKEQRRCRE